MVKQVKQPTIYIYIINSQTLVSQNQKSRGKGKKKRKERKDNPSEDDFFSFLFFPGSFFPSFYLYPLTFPCLALSLPCPCLALPFPFLPFVFLSSLSLLFPFSTCTFSIPLSSSKDLFYSFHPSIVTSFIPNYVVPKKKRKEKSSIERYITEINSTAAIQRFASLRFASRC